MIRLAIRGYAAGGLQFWDFLEVDETSIEELIPELAKEHAEALAAHELHMIEIEFLDEPNPLERFFRFGSDPRLMRRPVMVDLTKGNA